MKSHLKLSDNSHRSKVWSQNMMFYYINVVLDKFVADIETNELGLFKTANSYGPKKDLKITFHPFTWCQNWHLAVAFHDEQKIMFVNCSAPNPDVKDVDNSFPVKLSLKLEDFIIYTGHKVHKSSMKNPILFHQLFEPCCSINAINVLSVVYSFCIAQDAVKNAFLYGTRNFKKFEISEFYDEIKAIDRFGSTRGVLGNQVVNQMIGKANGKGLSHSKRGHENDQLFSDDYTNTKKHQTNSASFSSSTNTTNSTNEIPTAPSTAPASRTSSFIESPVFNRKDTHSTASKDDIEVLKPDHTTVKSKPEPQTKIADWDSLFPVGVAENFVEKLSDLEDLSDDLEVIDEVIEMLENFSHNKLTNPKAKHTESDFKTWSLVIREHLYAEYVHKTKLEFDETEAIEIFSVSHDNEVFPLIVENGTIYLVNIKVIEQTSITSRSAKVNVIEISDKPLKQERDILKSSPLKRLIELYGWERHVFITKINASKIVVNDRSGYSALIYALYCLHHFSLHEKFQVNYQPNSLNVDNYGIILQKLMHDIKDGKKRARDADFRNLMKYIR
ncbi:unnamed protein product [Ambrosiozyma monospora]|uniref:Unnamed protein product n=1 Tax=Ambrosiozyma monospora TaxID=43982 RepID=A0ACB5SY38_AMBMO|nr:unnamed protein product [Ambrosiozyma monospora]